MKIKTVNPVKFIDLDLNFIPHPSTGDVAVKINDAAIKKSISNLIRTNYHERLFHPEIGSGVTSLLFENFNFMIAEVLKNRITETINTFEPRVNNVKVSVQDNREKNSLDVTIQYSILNEASATSSVSVSLERLN